MSLSQDTSAPSALRHSSFGERLIEMVYVLILLVTVAGWTLIGFAVWVPLLIRTTTLLAGTVFYATLFRDRARVVLAEQRLHFAVRFYVSGFQHFINFYRQRHDQEAPIGLFEPLSELRWKELAVECVWIAGVWVVLYVVFHPLTVALLGGSR